MIKSTEKKKKKKKKKKKTPMVSNRRNSFISWPEDKREKWGLKEAVGGKLQHP